jgi:S1-C subfamily serine protease
MKRLVVSAILALSLLAPVSAANPWTIAYKTVKSSTIYMEICTAFMINASKRYALTAAHCETEKMLADGTTAFKVFVDKRKDLMIIRVNIDRPSLRLAPQSVEVGEEVASMGYGAVLEQPMFRIGHISNVNLQIEELSGPYIIVDNKFVPGQSGGPVVNQRGEVVGIVQMTSDYGFGLGVGRDVIEDKVGRFFE